MIIHDVPGRVLRKVSLRGGQGGSDDATASGGAVLAPRHAHSIDAVGNH